MFKILKTILNSSNDYKRHGLPEMYRHLANMSHYVKYVETRLFSRIRHCKKDRLIGSKMFPPHLGIHNAQSFN